MTTMNMIDPNRLVYLTTVDGAGIWIATSQIATIERTDDDKCDVALAHGRVIHTDLDEDEVLNIILGLEI